MRDLITPEIVAMPAVVGSPEECADQITRFAGRASEVCCYLPGYREAPADVADLVAALHADSA